MDISFERTWKRYPSPVALLSMLEGMYSFLPADKLTYMVAIPEGKKCFDLADSFTALSLGANNVATGMPSSPLPGSGFLEWVMNCSLAYIFVENNSTPADEARVSMLNTPWESQRPEVQKKIVTELLELLIGPDDVVSGLELARSSDELATTILAKLAEVLAEPQRESLSIFTKTRIINDVSKLTTQNVRSIIQLMIITMDPFQY
jgi:hypothetical protein